MEHIRKVIEIAEKLELKNIVSELEKIDFRSKQSDAKIVIPLVGEFSSGKTTLINALTDSKKLETATEPTTATIYDIHFGCERCYAEVITECDEKRVIEDIADLKNKEWVEVTATVNKEYWADYKGEGPVLHASKVEKTKAPKEEVISFV